MNPHFGTSACHAGGARQLAGVQSRVRLWAGGNGQVGDEEHAGHPVAQADQVSGVREFWIENCMVHLIDFLLNISNTSPSLAQSTSNKLSPRSSLFTEQFKEMVEPGLKYLSSLSWASLRISTAAPGWGDLCFIFQQRFRLTVSQCWAPSSVSCYNR